MRPIDADAFLERMKRTDRYFAVRFDIEEMPTLNIDDLRGHGYWRRAIVRGSVELYCSRCGQEHGTLYEDPFCSNCGARMDAQATSARWETDPYIEGRYMCSNCGEWTDDAAETCPSCGMKMEDDRDG